MQRPPGKDALQTARDQRCFSTDAEAKLWTILRNRGLSGVKFRRRVWLGSYITDFNCPAAELVIEADGGQHADRLDYDERRTAWLGQEEIRVLRFWNNDILSDLEGVSRLIVQSLTLPPLCERRAPPSPLQGEGL